MVFSSLEFLFLFFPISITAYFLMPKKHLKWRNLVLLAVSLIFYGWVNPVYVLLLICTIIISYFSGFGVARYKLKENVKTAKIIVIISVAVNLLILVFFKYAGSFIDNDTVNIIIPIGISFYILQSMSYIFDVYRGDAEVQKNIISFGTFIALFPKLVAGPIVKYKDMDNQLKERKESLTLIASGVRTFLTGLAKKVLLANMAGEMWKTFSSIPAGERTVAGAWLGIIFFSFQIYFDFSGYTDMAIGLGKIFGFKFIENFNYPYISKSITEFWQRWHISLIKWFNDYLYIPLGGNGSSKLINFRNILIVWVLIGIWHGAGWNFLVFGLYFSAILIIEKAFLLEKLQKIPAFFRHVYTILLIITGWILFVSQSQHLGNLGDGMAYLGNMFGIGTAGGVSQENIYDITRNFIFFVIMVIAATPLPKKLFYKFYEKSNIVKFAAYACGAAVLIFSVAYLVDSSFNPFLYFGF